MKSIIWLSAATLGLSAVAVAGSITCLPFGDSFPNGGGSAGVTKTVTCAGFTPDPGFNLSSVTLTYVADYEFATSSPTDVQFTFTPTPAGGVTYSPAASTIDVTGNFSSGVSATDIANAMNFNNSSFSSGITVNVTSKVVEGAVEESAAGVTLTYTEVSQTPEPATLAVMGCSLVGLGLLRSKKRS
jgi:hypothetical protein